MKDIDYIKEMIGYYKFWLAIFITVDISCMGWLFNMYNKVFWGMDIVVTFFCIILTLIIYLIKGKMLTLIDSLKN